MLAAEAQECIVWMIVPSLIAILAVITPSALAEWKLQKGGQMHLGSLGALSFPGHHPCALIPPQGFSHPPAVAPKTDRRWWVGGGQHLSWLLWSIPPWVP